VKVIQYVPCIQTGTKHTKQRNVSVPHQNSILILFIKIQQSFLDSNPAHHIQSPLRRNALFLSDSD